MVSETNVQPQLRLSKFIFMNLAPFKFHIKRGIGKNDSKTFVDSLRLKNEAAQLAAENSAVPNSDARVTELLKNGSLSQQAWALIVIRIGKHHLQTKTEAIAAI